MYRVGREEIEAIARVIESGQLFRYHDGGECTTFERRYAGRLGVEHVLLTTSGTASLTAGLAGMGIGPGDEVLVPACTYMATAVAVLAVGAIPWIVDVDESLTLDPAAMEAAIGPRTRAVIPVHMWGLVCDMDAICRIADARGVQVLEDACQCVGGAYKGRMVGSIGRVGAMSFNYFKNMTCGEGGAVVTSDPAVAGVARCMIDCCGFYWNGRPDDIRPFTACGSRASEIDGAMLNIQLDRIDGMVEAMRAEKARIAAATADCGLELARSNSPEWECGASVVYRLPSEAQAMRFAERVSGTVAGKTGRHVYTEWDPILERSGSFHVALNPYTFAANAECRMDYTPDMCERSLDILNRSVLVGTHPDHTEADADATVARVRAAASEVLA